MRAIVLPDLSAARRTPDIAYRVYLAECGTYVRVDVEGQIDDENANAFTGEAISAARDAGVACILIDARGARNVASTERNIAHARAARNPQVANRRALKRVVLVAEGDRSHDIAIRALQLQGHDITITRDEAWAERLACGL